MHSSISSSNPARRAIAWWLFSASVLLLAMEAGVRYLVPRFNRTQRRFNEEVTAAERLEKKPGSAASILLVGNSLTFTNIDVDALHASIDACIDAQMWSVDDTNYLDWYYGLKRVFRAGGRPSVVVIGGKSNHFAAPHYRGHFFSHYILHTRDVSSLVGLAEAGPTQASNVAIANMSAFMGSREQIYKRSVEAMVPGFAGLAEHFTTKPQCLPKPAPTVEALADRFKQMDALCREHGAQLVVLLMPTTFQDDHAELVLAAAQAAQVRALQPVADGVFPDDDYSDGLHMNSRGAARFTVELAKALDPIVNEVRP